MAETPDSLTPDELEAHAPELLPDREAMSLITPTPESLLSSVPVDAGDATDAAGSASGDGEPSVTDQPRSETFTSSDTAYAGPE
jgi:hypothetical protein